MSTQRGLSLVAEGAAGGLRSRKAQHTDTGSANSKERCRGQAPSGAPQRRAGSANTFGPVCWGHEQQTARLLALGVWWSLSPVAGLDSCPALPHTDTCAGSSQPSSNARSPWSPWASLGLGWLWSWSSCPVPALLSPGCLSSWSSPGATTTPFSCSASVQRPDSQQRARDCTGHRPVSSPTSARLCSHGTGARCPPC